jgi:hypothetical protein
MKNQYEIDYQQGYDTANDEWLERIDKIRAEIVEEMLSHSGTGEEVIQAYADGLKKGLDIIDKYKAESEDV